MLIQLHIVLHQLLHAETRSIGHLDRIRLRNISLMAIGKIFELRTQLILKQPNRVGKELRHSKEQDLMLQVRESPTSEIRDAHGPGRKSEIASADPADALQ